MNPARHPVEYWVGAGHLPGWYVRRPGREREIESGPYSDYLVACAVRDNMNEKMAKQSSGGGVQ